jgi:hypothetical protein
VRRPLRRRFSSLLAIAIAITLTATFSWAPSAAAITGPSTHEFGETLAGDAASTALSFSSERPVDEPAEAVGKASIGGADASQFVIGADTCSDSDVAVACRVTVTFAPSTAGAKRATLRLPGAYGDAEVVLRGDAFVAGRRVTSDAATLDLGGVLYDEFSTPGSVTLANTGDLKVTLAVEINGPDHAAFAVVNPSCAAATLEPGAVCRLDIWMIPGRVGTRIAELKVGCGAGCAPVLVSLRGYGSSPPLPCCLDLEENAPWSFYAKSARAKRSMVSVVVYTSQPAYLDIRVRRAGRVIARHRIGRATTGSVTVRMRVRRLRRGRPVVEVLARRGDESRLDRVGIR